MSEGLQEFVKRRADAMRTCEFGISYLDDALNGIRPVDLIVMGARTGAGKTELAAMIAQHNARIGKSVFFFALEAERYEILRRIKYRLFAREFFAHRPEFPSEVSLNFTDWLFDKYHSPDMEILEHNVNEMLEKEMENLQIYSPSVAEFSKKNFATVYEEVVGQGAQLVVLDHIHYLAPDERQNEYDHVKRTMWTLRDLINRHEVPIVAMSHLRKESARYEAIVPTLEEIHGSSEISKQANHVISIASAYQLPSKNSEDSIEAPLGSTLFKILKSRTGHAGAERYVGLMRFDYQTKTYEQRYVPYGINRAADRLDVVSYAEFERWMGLGREATC